MATTTVTLALTVMKMLGADRPQLQRDSIVLAPCTRLHSSHLSSKEKLKHRILTNWLRIKTNFSDSHHIRTSIMMANYHK